MSSIFNLTNRELTAHPLELIEKLLSGEDHELNFNEMIFGTRENVKAVIEGECEDN